MKAYDSLFNALEAKKIVKDVGLLSLSGREKFNPISLDASAGVVTGVRPTTEKIRNVALRLVPTFAAFPQDVKDAVAKYGEGTSEKGVLHMRLRLYCG